MEFKNILEKFQKPILIGLLGILFIGIGILLLKLNQSESPKIEIISEETTSAAGKSIFIDLEGAVEKPGVYEMPSDSRLNDLLIKAGGLSAEADRDWLAKNLNLALKLEDGQKIYIPRQGERVAELKSGNTKTTTLININSASVAQLDSLWGIGEARAQEIITNRPYQSIEELVSRKIIPQNVYEKIREQISIY